MCEINKLTPPELKAAMGGGVAGWGDFGSAREHLCYVQLVVPVSRRRCYCGCGRRATHNGMANGVALTTGCELTIKRWVFCTRKGDKG